MDLLTAALTGALVGLGLAVPLGATGVLLVTEGAERGVRAALPAAAAVATVDLAYCLAALTVGAALAPALSVLRPWPSIAGGLLLIALGARGLLRLLRRSPRAATAPLGPHRFALFAALTAVNPATLLYFLAAITGHPALVTTSAPTTATFALSAATASLAWNTALTAIGALLRRTAGPLLRTALPLAGHALVAALGTTLILQALPLP
ncbi:LysE family transporter [Rathayibacter sp. Leaf296]|uniref:LysE family transporter n=1 Tax=Rathayibacter sp. Leaf296 TaxID=1736327 RepID=UPI0007030E16|nr:LysE family transporter [Rathayibacter sp. Leaf296]KQQ10300.1 hypothetical protein ASF46_04305 [Rathayibacter sp. Leaf296]